MNPKHPPVILASTSPFRRELLSRLGLPFQVANPDVSEIPLPNESAIDTAERLAVAKAKSVADRLGYSALVIGSDQVAYCGSQRFGKPVSRENAVIQLMSMRSQTVIFHTGVCVLNSQSAHCQVKGIPTEVRFRDLREDDIRRYVAKEDAMNCAGSARTEGLGISLLEYIRGDDPSALIGLPLIALCEMLRNEGIDLP